MGSQSRQDVIQHDEQVLRRFGYLQELYRTMGGFSNFAISFTIISILSGPLTLFGFGLSASGPAAAAYGWPIVTIFVLFVALNMAETASGYPTTGGLYFWSSMLGGAGWGWFTGWFNLIGQVAITAGIDYGLAIFVDALMNQYVPSFPVSGHSGAVATLGIYAVILLIHALLNINGVRVVAFLNDVSVWWHIGGAFIIVAALIILAPHHAHVWHFVYGVVQTETGFPRWYGFLIGLLLASYTITGFDASAHMSEETIGASNAPSWGIVLSVAISGVVGYILLLGMVAAVPSLSKTLAAANPVLYVFTTRLGDAGGTLLFLVALVAMFFCGMSSVTANSRMIYAFARDRGLPGSEALRQLNRIRSPHKAIWLAVSLAFILAIPALWSTVVYSAVTSIGVIGLFISYVIPALLKLIYPSRFQPGPWNLGRFSKPVGVIAVAWVVFICILFSLPEVRPITASNFNYTPVVLGVVFAVLVPWYLIRVRYHFKGPAILQEMEGHSTTREEID
ncbi:MAG: amino acid permease [Firmicutes bacterium]|nr:amino acid permease [Bacillota bacterium]